MIYKSKFTALMIKLIFVMVLTMVSFYSNAFALDCTEIGGVDVAGNCTLSSTYTCVADTTIDIPGDFNTIAGVIDCNGSAGASDPCANGTNGYNLTINVGGNLNANAIYTSGGAGGNGSTGSPGCAGGNGGQVNINVIGNMTTNDMLANGAAGGNGGVSAAGGPGAGGPGGNGGTGGIVNIVARSSFIQLNTTTMTVHGGQGGVGAGGSASGGNGGNGGPAGTIDIYSCNTVIDGDLLARGYGGGVGGSSGGLGGSGGSGGPGGTINVRSGAGLIYTSFAHLEAYGGDGAVGGSGDAPGSSGNGGNGGTINGAYCSDFSLDDQGVSIDVSGGAAPVSGTPGAAGSSPAPTANAVCCSVDEVPALNEWGMIIFMLLAGFGSVYYLRRKRIES